MDRVADKPALNDWFADISVRTGLFHRTLPGLSGFPSGPFTSTVISISSPSGNHLVPSVLVRVSYHDSQG